MKRILVFSLTILVFASTQAAIIDTIQIYSQSMQKNIYTVVITPDNYTSAKELPVMYLLHGFSGNYLDWITKAKGFEKSADQYNLIIVCPDGGFGSWYWNSPTDPKSQYETFVSDELIKAIDTKYKTIKNRTGRAITGLSMVQGTMTTHTKTGDRPSCTVLNCFILCINCLYQFV